MDSYYCTCYLNEAACVTATHAHVGGQKQLSESVSDCGAVRMATKFVCVGAGIQL